MPAQARVLDLVDTGESRAGGGVGGGKHRHETTARPERIFLS